MDGEFETRKGFLRQGPVVHAYPGIRRGTQKAFTHAKHGIRRGRFLGTACDGMLRRFTAGRMNDSIAPQVFFSRRLHYHPAVQSGITLGADGNVEFQPGLAKFSTERRVRQEFHTNGPDVVTSQRATYFLCLQTRHARTTQAYNIILRNTHGEPSSNALLLPPNYRAYRTGQCWCRRRGSCPTCWWPCTSHRMVRPVIINSRRRSSLRACMSPCCSEECVGVCCSRGVRVQEGADSYFIPLSEIIRRRRAVIILTTTVHGATSQCNLD